MIRYAKDGESLVSKMPNHTENSYVTITILITLCDFIH